jgi:hypothetical protein
MVVCSPEPPGCRDGQYPILCACHGIYVGPGILIMFNGCALSRALRLRLSRWAIPSLMCVPRYLCRSINGQNTQFYAQYYAMCVLSQSPVAFGGMQHQVCGSTRSPQWTRTQCVVFVCFPEPCRDQPCPASGACHGVYSPLHSRLYVRMSFLLCVCRPLPRCKFIAKCMATMVPTIARSDLMGSVIGPMVYWTASTGLAFVRRTDQEPLFIC